MHEFKVGKKNSLAIYIKKDKITKPQTVFISIFSDDTETAWYTSLTTSAAPFGENSHWVMASWIGMRLTCKQVDEH